MRGRTGSCTILRGVVKSRGRKIEGAEHAYPLVVFFLLFFFFCNHSFIVFRYKKPHAALAMEKTKPINQKKHKQSKVTAPVSIHYRAGFSSAGPAATYNKESTN